MTWTECRIQKQSGPSAFTVYPSAEATTSWLNCIAPVVQILMPNCRLRVSTHHYITSIFASTHWLPRGFTSDFNILRATFPFTILVFTSGAMLHHIQKRLGCTFSRLAGEPKVMRLGGVSPWALSIIGAINWNINHTHFRTADVQN